MYDSELTALLNLRLKLASQRGEVQGTGIGIRARLTSLLDEVEKHPTPDPRLEPLLARLRSLALRHEQLEPEEVQARLVRLLAAALEAPQ